MSLMLRIMFIICWAFLPLFPQVAGKTGTSNDLIIQNRKIFTFRANLGALEAEERLHLAKNRISNMPAVDLLEPVQYTLAQEGALISVGKHPLFSITAGDLDTDIGQTLETAAKKVQHRLGIAMEAEAYQRSFKNLIHGALKSLAAIMLFLILTLLIGRWIKFAKHKIMNITISKLPKVLLGRVYVIELKHVYAWLLGLIRIIHYAVVAMIAYMCLAYVLNCFPYTQPWAETLESGLAVLILDLGKSVLHGIPGLFAIAIIIFVAKGLTNLINTAFDAAERGDAKIPGVYKDVAAPTRRIVLALLWIFVVIMAYPYIPGNESIAFKSISVFIGLLVSFGSAGIFNQAMNGLAIMYSRTFNCGDYVKIGNEEGTVSELTMLFTRLHTIRQEEIIIPNSVVISQTTHNYTRLAADHGVGISTKVGIGYDAPWRQVHSMLMTAAENTKGLTKDPAPYIIQTALNDSCVEYTLVVHMVTEPKLRPFVKSELHQNIQDVFNQQGVKILTPTYIESL